MNREAGVRVDADVIESLAAQGAKLERQGDLPTAISVYESAVNLYRGEVCIPFDAPGALERERLRELALNMLGRVSTFYFQTQDYASCLERATKLLRNDPCREDIHRMVMRCYMRVGQRARALNQYRVCEALLRREFDATPEAATVELFDAIRHDPANA